MQKIVIPYYSDLQSILGLQCLAEAPGLIWYHNGQDQKDSEWLSAWPTEEYEYLGNQRIRVIDLHNNRKIITDDWFEFLKANMPNLEPLNGAKFNGGLAGHLSYDLGLELLNIRSRLPKTELPLATVGQYLWCLYVDHSLKSSYIVIQDDCPQSIVEKIYKLITIIENNPPASPPEPNLLDTDWHCNFNQHDYRNAFTKIKRYIVAGDVYQINLTRQWVNEHNGTDDWALYGKLTKAMPAPFSVFQRSNNHSLLSVSPERFIQIMDGKIMTQPIKGTRPRSTNIEQDLAFRRELENSKKDKAENLMIVDLLRNDVAKNAVPGSISVEKLFEVQSFKNVHHLVSTITAVLDATKHPLDVLRDAFPGGSITGAPKKRAMEIIDELETVRRGNYCGCSFYLTADQQLDSNILIRTITLHKDQLSCSGGGGIVFDSNCEAEYEESSVKVNNILNSLKNNKGMQSAPLPSR